jgi:hypothetical protein
MTWLEISRVRELAWEHPLARAFVCSLLIHALLYSTWRVGRRWQWWDAHPAWLNRFYKLLEPAPAPPKLARLLPQIVSPEPRRKEIPLTFIEVPVDLAVEEPPKEANYYGAFNARAAQPEPAPVDRQTPKIDGTQDKVPRLEDNPRPVKFPLQPDPAALAKTAPPPTPPPAPAPQPGDLTVGQPSRQPADTATGTGKPDRPRTLAAARAARGLLAGERMRQDGGVSRRGRLSVDVKGSPFGAYDAAFIAAVQQRWYDLIDSSQVVPRSGKVQLQFRLTYDGRITDMRVNEETVGDLLTLLCQRAVLDPAPYARWPADMRRMIGQDYREVTITFYYN